MFTLCVLLYGEHTNLAHRCLYSIKNSVDWSLIADVRIGLNAVCTQTRDLSHLFARQAERPVYIYQEATQGKNVYKYPMMRRMFYDPAHPIKSKWVMWFDDDSYVKTPFKDWWWAVARICNEEVPTMIGSRYKPGYHLNNNERRAIEVQPWYGGLEIPDRYRPFFVTGGWWVAQYAMLRRWDYPFRELKHNGGDVILGELCRQRGYAVRRFNSGVGINADGEGNESAAKRRGETTKRPFETWNNMPPDLSHQQFDVTVTEY